jgi:REP element-mobilizing transposase RayT
MAYIRTIRERRSVRMQGYDYTAAGAYFVTVCAHERRCLFGEIASEQMALNHVGRTIERCWLAIPDHFPGVELDEFVLMPNHLHGIVVLPGSAATRRQPTATGLAPPRTSRPIPRSISTVVGSFKSAAAREINRLNGAPSAPVWQRSYYEHVIRDESSLNQIRQYIADNPRLWAEDAENPFVKTVRGR